MLNYTVHIGSYKPGFIVFPRKTKQGHYKQPVQIDHIRINHYWTRAEDFFYNVKIDRQLTLKHFKSRKDVIKMLADLNQVEDPIMMRFVPQLRERMHLDNN